MASVSVSDEILLNYIRNNKVSLNNFAYAQTNQLTAIGSSVKFTFRITEDFFLQDLAINIYDTLGSVYGVSENPRDKFTVQIQDNNSGQYWFESAIDVVHFTPHIRQNIFPEIIKSNTIMTATIYHNPTTNEGEYDNKIVFPVTIEIVMKGAKLKQIN